MKSLLVDYTNFDITPQMITESEQQNGGRVILQGVLQRAGAKNQNGRVYPKDILAREVAEYKKGPVAERRALGELDHPESSVVNLSNASHNVLDCWFQDNDVVGKVEILDTPSGKILKELLRAGIKLGISSRGLGSVRELGEGTVEVQDDFELICWDFVSNPSTHGAFMKPMNESVNLSSPMNRFDSINNIIREIICETTGKCSINHTKHSCKCGGTCGHC
tara:strand:+ start:2386 stop:3048 length:663 start_codon:yes stop_codon:yes gene_type:complete